MPLMWHVPEARRLWRWIVLCLVAWLALPALAQGVQPIPALSARVVDQTGTLAAADVAALEAQLQAFEQRRGTQIVVLMVRSTAPEDIADYTQRLGDAWKIGRRDVGDGLLFVIALDDRRLRIAPAKTLEGAIPDVLARRIIDQVVTPAFRRGAYADGIRAGLDHLQARIEGEDLPLPEAVPDRPRAGGIDWFEVGLLFLFAVPLISAGLRSMLGNRLGSLAAGGVSGLLVWSLSGLLWLAILAGLAGLLMSLFVQQLPVQTGGRRGGGHWGGGTSGGWGGGGWSSGGGGFSSGGGGDFGGGGASGSW